MRSFYSLFVTPLTLFSQIILPLKDIILKLVFIVLEYSFSIFNLFIPEKMGCNCSSDYSDNDWIENLDEICEHCNCPIPPSASNPVSVHFCVFSAVYTYLCITITCAVHCTLYELDLVWVVEWEWPHGQHIKTLHHTSSHNPPQTVQILPNNICYQMFFNSNYCEVNYIRI